MRTAGGLQSKSSGIAWLEGALESREAGQLSACVDVDLRPTFCPPRCQVNHDKGPAVSTKYPVTFLHRGLSTGLGDHRRASIT